MIKDHVSQSPLKIVFMGTPNFSVNPLKALIESKHSLEAVYTQPPRKSGRAQWLILVIFVHLAELRLEPLNNLVFNN